MQRRGPAPGGTRAWSRGNGTGTGGSPPPGGAGTDDVGVSEETLDSLQKCALVNLVAACPYTNVPSTYEIMKRTSNARIKYIE